MTTMVHLFALSLLTLSSLSSGARYLSRPGLCSSTSLSDSVPARGPYASYYSGGSWYVDQLDSAPTGSSNFTCPVIQGRRGTLICSDYNLTSKSTLPTDPIPQALIQGIIDCPVLSPPQMIQADGSLKCTAYAFLRSTALANLCTFPLRAFCRYDNLPDNCYYPGQVATAFFDSGSGYYLTLQNILETYPLQKDPLSCASNDPYNANLPLGTSVCPATFTTDPLNHGAPGVQAKLTQAVCVANAKSQDHSLQASILAGIAFNLPTFTHVISVNGVGGAFLETDYNTDAGIPTPPRCALAGGSLQCYYLMDGVQYAYYSYYTNGP